jgi:hypothetical protein
MSRPYPHLEHTRPPTPAVDHQGRFPQDALLAGCAMRVDHTMPPESTAPLVESTPLLVESTLLLAESTPPLVESTLLLAESTPPLVESRLSDRALL